MKKKIREYYRAVRLSNAFIIIFSAILIVLGIALYLFTKSPLAQGAIFVIFSFGLVQMGLSTIRFFRSFKEYRQAIVYHDQSIKDLQKHEIDKLEKRNAHINWARKAELMGVVLFFGLCILAVFLDGQDFLFGSSAVLLIQLAVMLSYDLIRQYHIREYIRQLNKKL